jgi:hypothetical protein
MIQRRHRARLAIEALRKPLGGNLDGNVALQARVMCPIHLPHPACADHRADLIRPQFVADRERHTLDLVQVISIRDRSPKVLGKQPNRAWKPCTLGTKPGGYAPGVKNSPSISRREAPFLHSALSTAVSELPKIQAIRPHTRY